MASEKILVTDDDLDTLRLLEILLQQQGYRTIIANSGARALELVEQEKPELVLLDVMMPEMDGIEVARRLRSSQTTKDILIIMFTAKANSEDKLKGFDAGADDYLIKPIQPRELLAHVRSVLQHSVIEKKFIFQ